jgi:hypothetical protein
VTFCQYITDTQQKSECIVFILRDKKNLDLYSEYCPKIEDEQLKVMCHYNWAYDARDPSICDRSGLPYIKTFTHQEGNGKPIQPCLEKRPL